MYKKTSFIILALLGAFTVNAQTQKGNQLLGGSIFFSTSKNTNDYFVNPDYQYNASNERKFTGFSIGPSYSYFVANNLDLGFNAGYNTSKITYTYPSGNINNQPGEAKTNGYSASVYLRKYYLYNNKIGIRTGPFAQYSYSRQKEKYANPNPYNNEYDKKDFGAGLGLDLVFFPTRHLGFSTTIGTLAYSHSDREQYNNHYKDDSFNLSLATSGLTLSAFYAFGK